MPRKRKNQDASKEPNKRPKLDFGHIFDTTGPQRPTDVLRGMAQLESGYIKVVIKRVRPFKPHSTLNLDVECTQDGGVKIGLGISFGKTCATRLKQLGVVFMPCDTLAVALHGVKVTAHNSDSASASYGRLAFPDGVALKFVHKVASQSKDLFNTWQDEPQHKPEDESWFSSPEPPDDMDVDIHPHSEKAKKCQNVQPAAGNSSATKSAVVQASKSGPSCNQGAHPNTSKRKLKRLAKEEKRRQLRNANVVTAGRIVETTAVPETEKSVVPPNYAADQVAKLPKPIQARVEPGPPTKTTEPEATVTQVAEPSALPKEPEAPDVPPSFETGLKAGPYSYVSVAQLRSSPGEKNVIGLVLSCEKPQSMKSGDWEVTLRIFDPSIYEFEDRNDLSTLRHHVVNCFQSQQKVWLPSAKPFDVVLLRAIKPRFGRDVKYPSSVGYKDKLAWCTVDTETGQPRAPEHNGFTGTHSASNQGNIFTPNEEELAYAILLASWWKNIEKRTAERSRTLSCNITQTSRPVTNPVNTAPQQTKSVSQNIVQISRPTTNAISQSNTGRKFHTIEELKLDVGPGSKGYFNCVVEVLYLWEDYYPCLYVTDYTENPHLAPRESNWCPPGMSRGILPISCFDEARETATHARVPPGFYQIINCKIKANREGYFEAKIFEWKVTRLEEDIQNPMLSNLLKRKRQLLQGNAPPELPPWRPIKDATIDDLFSSVVEVLDVSGEPGATSFAWVTDYTARRDLVNCGPSDQFKGTANALACRLPGSILKIMFEDEQSKKVNDMKPGSFWMISNLRLVGLDTIVRGKVGGDSAQLVRQIREGEGDKGLKELLSNKEKLKKALDTKAKESGTAAPPLQPDSNAPLQWTTIKELNSMKFDNESPLVHVRAKVKKIRDKDPQHWYRRYCLDHKIPVVHPYTACSHCGLQSHRVQATILVGLEIEDSNGDRASVCINEEVKWLRDVDIHTLPEEEIIKTLQQRMQPITGSNLVSSKPDGPWVDMLLAIDDLDGAHLLWLAEFKVNTVNNLSAE